MGDRAAVPSIGCLTDAAWQVAQPEPDTSRMSTYAAYVARLSHLAEHPSWDIGAMLHEDWLAVCAWRTALTEAIAERQHTETERQRRAERARTLTGVR